MRKRSHKKTMTLKYEELKELSAVERSHWKSHGSAMKRKSTEYFSHITSKSVETRRKPSTFQVRQINEIESLGISDEVSELSRETSLN